MLDNTVDQSKDFVTIGIERARDTVMQAFKGTNIYLIIFLIVLFLGVAFYVYTTYMSPMFENDYVANNENKTNKYEKTPSFDMDEECEDESEDESDNIKPKPQPKLTHKNAKKMIMYLIKTEWCPYSQKAIQEYEKLKKYYKDKLQGKYNVEFKTLDGDNDKVKIDKFTNDVLNANNKEKENMRQIEGYPTIYLVKNDGSSDVIYEYEATPKMDTLVEFIMQVDIA